MPILHIIRQISVQGRRRRQNDIWAQTTLDIRLREAHGCKQGSITILGSGDLIQTLQARVVEPHRGRSIVSDLSDGGHGNGS